MTLDQIICGDNVAVLSTLPDECIDLVVTSPPYDDLRTYGGHSWNFETLAAQLVRVLKPGGVIVWVVTDATVNGSETGNSMEQALHFKKNGLNLHDTMIYDRGFAKFPDATRYGQSWEFMFVLSKGKPKTFNPLKEKSERPGKRMITDRNSDGTTTRKTAIVNEEKQRRNVWTMDAGYMRSTKDKYAFDHPAIFPEELPLLQIQSWSNPGDLVLDPFAGSGTTLKAAKELNRHWLGIEVNSAYVEICHKRLAQDVLKLEDVK
jgi:site-specific DNA-methyltransferase (adenine-specific)